MANIIFLHGEEKINEKISHEIIQRKITIESRLNWILSGMIVYKLLSYQAIERYACDKIIALKISAIVKWKCFHVLYCRIIILFFKNS